MALFLDLTISIKDPRRCFPAHTSLRRPHNLNAGNRLYKREKSRRFLIFNTSGRLPFFLQSKCASMMSHKVKLSLTNCLPYYCTGKYSPFVSQSRSLSSSLSSSGFGSPSERTMVSISWKLFWNSKSVQWSKLQCPHSFLILERTSLALVWTRVWKTDALSRIPRTADRSHELSNPANGHIFALDLLISQLINFRILRLDAIQELFFLETRR